MYTHNSELKYLNVYTDIKMWGGGGKEGTRGICVLYWNKVKTMQLYLHGSKLYINWIPWISEFNIFYIFICKVLDLQHPLV